MTDYLNPEEERRRIAAENAARPVNPAWNGQVARNPFAAPTFEELYPEVSRMRDVGREAPAVSAPAAEVVPEPPPAREGTPGGEPAEPLPAASPMERPFTPPDQRRAQLARVGAQLEYIETHMGPDVAGRYQGGTAARWRESLANAGDFLANADQETFDKFVSGLAEWAETRFTKAEKDRALGEVARDAFVRSWEDTKALWRNLYNLGAYELGGRSREDFVAAATRENERAERLRISNPERVSGIEGIRSVGDFGWWALEGALSQSVNLLASAGAAALTGGASVGATVAVQTAAKAGAKAAAKAGVKAAVKGAVKTAVGSSVKGTAKSMAAQRIGALVGSQAAGAVLNAGDIAGQLADEAIARGEDPSVARLLAETAVYTGIDAGLGVVARNVRRLFPGASEEVVARRAMQEARKGFHADSRSFAGQMWSVAKSVAGDMLGEGAGEMLQTEATRVGNFLQYGTGLRQGEESWTDALLADVNEFAVAAVSAGVPGAAGNVRALASQRAEVEKANTAGRRVSSVSVDEALRRKFESARLFERSARDAADSDAFDALGGFDKTLCNNALKLRVDVSHCDAWLRGRVSATEGERAAADRVRTAREEAAESLSRVREAMSPAGRAWLDAYTGLFDGDFDSFPADDPRFAPDFDVDAARRNFAAQDEDASRNGGVRAYTDGRGAGDAGRVQFFEKRDEGNNLVIEVRSLSGRAMPERTGNEFYAREFDGDENAARAAALDFASKLSGYERYIAWKDEQMRSYAQEFLDRNYAGKTAYILRVADDLPLRGIARDAQEAESMRERGMDVLHVLSDGERAEMLDEKMPDGFAAGTSGFHLGGVTDSVFLLPRAAESPLEIAATLTHENFHADFAALAETQRIDLEKELGAAKVGEMPEREIAYRLKARLLGIEVGENVLTQDAMDAIDQAEEALATRAESEDGGEELKTGLFHSLLEKHPKLGRLLGQFFEEKVGVTPRNEAEIADFIFRATEFGKSENVGAENFAVIGKLVPRDADADEGSFRAAMRILNPTPENAAPNDINLVPGEEGEGGFANPEADEETERGVALSGELSRRRDAARARETTDRAEAERKAREKAVNKRQGDERAKAIATRKKVEAEFAARENAEREASERKAREEREASEARKKSVDLARRNDRVGKIYGKFLDFIDRYRPDVGDDEAFMRAHEAEFSRLEKALQEVNPQEVFEAANDIREAIRKENRKDRTPLSSEEKESERTVAANEALDRREAAEFADEEAEWKRLAEYVKQGEEREEAERQDERADVARTAETVEAGEARDEAERQKAKDADEKLRREAPWSLDRESDSMLEADERLTVAKAAKATAARNVEKAKSAHLGGEAKSERVQRAEKALGQAEKNLAKAERGQRDAYAAPEKRRRSMSFWNNRPVLSEQDAADRRVARRLDAARRSAFAANLARGLPRNVAWARAQVVKLPDATPDATKRWTVANADPTSFPVSAAIGVHGTLLGEVTPNSELWEYVSDMTPAQARAAGLAEMKVELRGKSIRPGETGANAVRRLTDPEGVSPSGRGWASAFPTGHAADSVVERLAEDLAANGYRIAPDAKESDVVEDLVTRLSDERARIDDMISRSVSSLLEDEADRQEVRRSRSEWGVSEDGANLDDVRDEVERRIWSAARDETPDLSFLGEEWAAATPDQRREWLDQEAAAQEAMEDAIAKGDEELRRNREAAESVRQSDAGERPVEESDYPDIDELDGGIHFRSSASFSGEALSRESARVLDALRPLLRGIRVIVSRDPAEAARRERRRLGVAPSGRNKQSGAEYPDAAGEIASLRFAVGKKRRVAYGDVLAKSRPDLDAESVLKELDKFDDPKKEKIALHWVVRGGLALPEDAYKIDDALDVAAKAKVDPFAYKSPDELLLANKQFKPTARPIDPATVPELSDARDEGDGIVSYEVQDDRQGQAAMRRIIDTHWGEDANPWCLLARNARDPDRLDSSSQINWGEVNDWFYSLPVEKRREITKDAYDPDDDSMPHPYTKSRDYLVSEAYFNENAGARDEMALENAWNYWQQYSALPKRVAFKDGRLLAFMATDEGRNFNQYDGGDEEAMWFEEKQEEYQLKTGLSPWIVPGRGYTDAFQEWLNSEAAIPQKWWDRQDESHPDLDWARSADTGLREARRRKNGAGQRVQTATMGIQGQPTNTPSNRAPLPIGSNAGQKLGALAGMIAQNGARSPGQFLKSLASALGAVWSNVDKSLYFKNTATGTDMILRLADHRGNATTFAEAGEFTNNFGIVVKMSEKRFKADVRVDYREEVFFPDRLSKETESGIARGLASWVERGRYDGPKGNLTDASVRRSVSGLYTGSAADREVGQTLGVYDTATGDVFLSPDATPETVAHEILGHAVWAWSREGSPELHEKMRQFATEAPQTVRDYVMRNYPELDQDGDAFLDELCARALEEDPEIGKMLKTAAEKSWWRRVLDAIKSLWRRFRGANGMGKYSALTPKASVRAMVRDALAGRTFGEAPAASPNGAAREARTEVLPDALSAHMEAVGVPEEGREQATRLVQGQLFAIDEMAKDGYVYPGTPEAAAAEPRKKISMKKPVAPPPVYTAEEKTRAFRALEAGKWADSADWALAQKMLNEGLTVSSVMPELWGGEKLSWPIRGFRIAKPADVAALAQSIRSPYQESVKAVFLDRRGVALDARIVSLGALSMTLGDPLTMLSGAPDGTVGIVLSHNHPSGDPTPSQQDEMLTRDVSDACQTLGYKFVDHVVTNGTRFHSFRSDSSLHDVFDGVFESDGAYGFRGRLRSGENDAPEFVPGKAPWEAVAADERQELVIPAITFEVAEDFRSDDEDSAFVVHLDHRQKLVAVSKIKPEELASDDFISRLARKVVAERASDLWMLFCGSAPVDVAGLLERGVSEKLHKPLVDVIYPKDGAAYGHASLAYNYKDAAGWTNDAVRAARTMGLTKDAAKKWLAKRKAPPPMQGNAPLADGGIHFRSAESIAPSTAELAEAARQYDEVVARYTNPDGTRKPGWKKAPNGKPTNLTERQWVQVRTENFKRWFGDWQSAAEVLAAYDFCMKEEAVSSIAGTEFVQNGKGDLVNRVAAFFASEFNGKAVSPVLGEVILDRRGVKDSLSHGIGRVKAAAYAAVRDVIEKGLVFDSQDNWKGRGVDTFVIAAPIKIGATDYICEVIVQRNRESGRQAFYLHEVNVKEKVAGAIETSTREAAPATTAAPVRSILAQRLLEVKQNAENVSKVVDENGEPLVVAHSTDAEFTVFRDMQKNDAGWLGAGFYFFGDRSLDGQYGRNVMECFLNVREPYFISDEERDRLAESDDAGTSAEFSEEIRGEGYDGVYYNGDLNREWAVFSPSQVKSATDNAGTFSERSDIRFRSASSVMPSDVVGARTRDAEARANAILPGGYSWHPEHRKRQEMAEQAIALMDSDPEISARVRAKLLAPAADGRQPEALNSDEMGVAFILLRQSERAVMAAQDAARAAKRNGEDVATVRLAEAAAAAAEGMHAKLVEGYNRSGSTASAAMNIRQVAYDAATDTFAGRMADLEKSMDEARSTGRLRTGASVSAGARGRIIGGVRRLQKLVSALRLAEKNAEDENVKKLLSDILAIDAAEAKRTAARGAASKMPVLSREELVEEGKARYQTLVDKRGAPFNPANPADRLDLHSLVRWIGRELTRADVAAGRPIASADAFRSDLAAVCREIITPFASLDDRAWADIFSNYGIIREADTEEVARRMNQLTELERLVSQLQDIEKKQLPRRSGQQRTESSVEAEELQKKINKLLKDAGLSVPEGEDPKHFRKNTLQIVKDGMRRQMALLQKAIDEKKPVELNRDPVLYDEEATDLKTQLEALRAQYHEMFDVELTDDERVKKLLDFYAKREQKALEALEKARKGEFRGQKEPTRDAWLRENDLRVQVAAQRLADIREEMHALENAAGEEAWMSDYSVAVRRALASRERSLRRYQEFRANPDLWFNRDLRRRMLDVSGAKEVIEAQKKVDAERAEWEKMKQDIILDNMNFPAKTWESVKALKDVSKRTLASLDLSGIYVQCAVAMLRKNPRYAAKTIRQGVRALFSDKSAGEYMDELHKDPRWRLVTEKMGVRISEYDPNGAGEMEEMRASTRLAQRWMEKSGKTIGGKAYNALMAASDRGFTVPVNMIRFAYATELAELAHKAKGKDLTDDELRQLGRVVNMETGRGDFFGNPEMSAALAKVFWAPAKWSGQIQTLLLPISVATHGELDPKVRREIVRRAWMQPLAGYALYATMFYILRCLLKGEDDDEKGDFIEANPLNPMFGRLNIGGQRFSLTGGLESYITFASRMVTGKTQNPAGKTTEVQKRSDLVWRQLKNKSTPEIGTILQFLDRTTVDGRKIVKGVTPIGGRVDAVTGQREIGTVNFLVGNSVLPLTARDIRDLITKGDTNVGQTALLAALTFLGANSQDYGFDPFEAAEARFLAAEKAWFSKNPVSGRFDYGKVKPMTDIERRSLLIGELGPYIQAHGEGRATLDRIREIDNTLKNGWKLRKGKRRPVSNAEKEQLLLLRDQLKLSFRAIWNPTLRQALPAERQTG